MTPFNVISADPPWPTPTGFKFGTNDISASKRYDLMTMDEIRAFVDPKDAAISPDAVLFLWRVSSMVEEAYSVVRAWGFKPKSEVVWIKQKRSGARHFGPGRFVHGEHESCIIATRGKFQFLTHGNNVRSTFDVEPFEAPVGRHSAKPDFFYTDVVEKLVKGPYLELFAREQRPGWVVMGNEL